jgi:hypothetical protein
MLVSLLREASGGRSVGIVRSRTQTMEFFFSVERVNFAAKLGHGAAELRWKYM